MSASTPAPHASARRPAGRVTLLLGAAGILAVEALLAFDVSARGGALVPPSTLPAPQGALEQLARHVAIFTTPLCWTFYLFLLDGLFAWRASRRADAGATHAAATHDPAASGSPIRRAPRRLLFCYVVSLPTWLLFEALNEAFLDAWRYHGIPPSPLTQNVGYLLSFGAITPAMLLSAEGLRRLGLERLTGRGLPIGPRARTGIVIAGVAAAAYPLLVRAPEGTLTLWLALLLLLDPLNHRLGGASIVGDWRAGRYGRTAALLAGGLWCGLLWEFWNYWAAAKWTYHLPFLGALEQVRYFEMPVLGLLGFPPFALECWAAFQTLALLAQRAGLRGVALPAEAREVL